MMNKTIVGGIIVLVIVGGLVVYSMSKNTASPTATSTTQDTPSDTVTTTTTTTTPVASPIVTTGTLVIVSNSAAVVTGKVTPNGAQTSYWYEYGSTNALGTRTATQSVGGGFVNITTPAIITGLSANTSYYFRLNAQNKYGTVAGQTYGFKTNSNPPLQGTAPTIRTDVASTVTRTTANLNGHVTPNGSDTSYWFEYGETGDLGNTTAFQSAGNGTTAQEVSTSLAGLKPLTKYYFRVNAQNQFGTMTGGTDTFTTNGPSASGVPTVVTTNAGSIATSSVAMRGHLNPNNYPTTYWFDYGTDSSLGSILGSSTRTELTGSTTVTVTVSADVRGLTRNTKYYYQLAATNSYGTVRGDIVAFTTKH